MQEAWDKNGKLYYVDDNGNRVQPNQNYNPFEKLQRKAQANLENVKSFINNSDTNSQSYKDKINLALGLITAPMGGSSLLASKGATALTPLVGKNIGKAISSSAIGGATGSGVAGFGRGLVEDKNPLLTMVSDGALGLLFGGAFGLAGGKIGKKLAEKNLQNGNIAPQKYFDDYVVGLKNPDRKDLRDYRSFNLSGELNNGNTQVIYDTPDEFIDLTNAFDSTPTMEEVKNFLRESAKTGKKFETSSPDYFLDVLDSSKKIDHIAKSSKFKTMNKSQKKRHNKYVLAFDDISKTLKKNGEGVENTKPDKKPDVKSYHEFNTTAKFNEKDYPLTVFAEQFINEPDTIPQTYHLYDILENKKSPSANSLKSVNLGDDTNIITNNLDNINPSAGLYEKIVDNSVNLQNPIPKGYMRLYRGLQEEFNPNYDKSKLDNVNGYESWTDNYDLAKAYGDNVYYIDIPENTIAKEIIDENPKSLTYGDRHLIYEHDKPVGIKNKNGKEYMLYTYHENYPNIKYNKI